MLSLCSLFSVAVAFVFFNVFYRDLEIHSEDKHFVTKNGLFCKTQGYSGLFYRILYSNKNGDKYKNVLFSEKIGFNYPKVLVFCVILQQVLMIVAFATK